MNAIALSCLFQSCIALLNAEKPEKRTLVFERLGVKVELDFQSNFNNLLHVFVIVLDPGHFLNCVAYVSRWSPVWPWLNNVEHSLLQ